MGKFQKISNIRFKGVLPVLLLFCLFYPASAKRVIADTVHYGGGVQTFNGRTGAVMPQSGDYNASQVGLGNVPNANPFDGSATFTDIKTKGPWADVRAYGATCSTTTESVTATADSSTVTVGAIGDFQVGQSVVIPLAGAMDAPATPAITFANVDSFHYNPEATPPNLSAYVIGNSVDAASVCTTDTTTSAYHNASCTTTYGYTIRAVGFDGAISAPSSVTYVANGPATISLANHIFLQWATDANAVGYVVNRCTGTSCTPNYNSIYKVLPNLPVGQTASRTFSFMDMGNQFGHSEYTLTGSAQAGILNTTITAISGTTVTLANAPSQSGTFTMYHDDEPAFEAAALAENPLGVNGAAAGGQVLVPRCSNPYNFGQAMSLVGMLGLTIKGQGIPYNNSGGSQINWLGPLGGIVFNGNLASNIKIENIGVPSGSYNDTPGIIFDPDKYTGPTGNVYGPGGNPTGRTANTTAWVLRNVECGESGICLNLGGKQNVDLMSFDHLTCDTPNGYGGWACVYGNSTQTYDETFKNLAVVNRDFGINFIAVGSFDVKDANFEQNIIDASLGGISTNAKIDGCVTELAQEFLNLASASPLEVNSCRIGGPNPGPDGYFLVSSGSLEFSNNTVEAPSAGGVANMSLRGKYGSGNLLLNNNFGVALSSGYPATPGNEPVTDYNGGQFTGGPYVAIGDRVNHVMVPISVVGAGGDTSVFPVTFMNASVRQMADTSPMANFKPSVSSCGTGAIANGTNMAMVITVGSGVTTSCAVTFNTNQPFANAPTCTFQDITRGITLKQASLTATGVVLNAPSGVSDFENDTINGMCVGN
ncbi:MAG: hypothetical protein M0018_08140 [Nitrospiraceae bacterium]|nr:hypothetical protein [Nitrospiraceae bacterium]